MEVSDPMFIFFKFFAMSINSICSLAPLLIDTAISG